MVAQSLARQNYTQAAEDALNQQIQVYQTAQHTYLAASAYFDQCSIALPVKPKKCFFFFFICFNNKFVGFCKVLS